MSRRSNNKITNRFSLNYFRLLLLLLGTVFSLSAVSQNYPVQATASLVPPYTPYLGDYVSASTEKLHVQLLLKDLTVNDYHVKLRIKIEGVGITISSLPNIPVPPIRLQGGSPIQLTSFELKPYFDPANLEFQGLDRAEFIRTGRLPEGLYRFTIEALDFNREKQASNPATAVAWIVLNDPPLLNLPFDQTKTSITLPQFIAFQWTPRHMGSPNAAFSTEYTFKLVEMWPIDRDPNDAILSQRPIFETTTTLNQLVYGPGEPQLLAGRTYAWQVTAKDTEGRDLFKNQGRSEVRTFKFGDACLPPVNMNSPTQGISYVRLAWDTDPLHDNYTIRYREQGKGSWYENKSITGLTQLNDLSAGKTYEYQIQAQCGVITSDYSSIATASTGAISESQFACGTPYVPVPVNPNEPALQLLTPNDIIYYHKYKITVTKVTASSGGQFSGDAIQEIPFLNYASIRVTFKDIRVTQSHNIVAGQVISVFDPNSNMVFHDDKKQPASTGGVQQNQGQDAPITIVAQPGVPVIITGTIDSVSVNTNGEIVVEAVDGKQTIITQAKDPVTGEKVETIVSDSVGNTYKVDKDGKITKSDGAVIVSNSSGSSTAGDLDNNFYIFYLHFEDFKFYYCTPLPEEQVTEDHKKVIQRFATNSSPMDFARNCDLTFTDGKIVLYKPLHIIKDSNGKLINALNYYDDQLKALASYRYKYLINETEYAPNSTLEAKNFTSDVELKLLVAKQEGDFKVVSSMWIRKAPAVKLDGSYRIFHKDKMLDDTPNLNQFKVGSKLKLEVKFVKANGEIETIDSEKDPVVWDLDLSSNKTAYEFEVLNTETSTIEVKVKEFTAFVKIQGTVDYKEGVFSDPNIYLDEAKKRINKASPGFFTSPGIQLTISLVQDANDAFTEAKRIAPSGNTFGVAGMPIKSNNRLICDPALIVRESDGCIRDIPILYKISNGDFMNYMRDHAFKDGFIEDESVKKLFDRVAATYPVLGAEISDMISKKAVEKLSILQAYFDNGKLAYKLTDVEISGYLTLSQFGQIHLNSEKLLDITKYAEARPKSGHSISSSDLINLIANDNARRNDVDELIKRQFTRVLIHEVNHIFYTKNHLLDAFKWSFVDNKSIHDCYPSTSGDDCVYCSMAHGHEKNNPDGQQACAAQCSYPKPVYYEN